MSGGGGGGVPPWSPSSDPAHSVVTSSGLSVCATQRVVVADAAYVGGKWLYLFGAGIAGVSKRADPVMGNDAITGLGLYVTKLRNPSEVALVYDSEMNECRYVPAMGAPSGVASYAMEEVFNLILSTLPSGFGISYSLLNLVQTLQGVGCTSEGFSELWNWVEPIEAGYGFYSFYAHVAPGSSTTLEVNGGAFTPYGANTTDRVITPNIRISITAPGSSASKSTALHGVLMYNGALSRSLNRTRSLDQGDGCNKVALLEVVDNRIAWCDRTIEFYQISQDAEKAAYLIEKEETAKSELLNLKSSIEDTSETDAMSLLSLESMVNDVFDAE